jgi:hypothetical protein
VEGGGVELRIDFNILLIFSVYFHESFKFTIYYILRNVFNQSDDNTIDGHPLENPAAAIEGLSVAAVKMLFPSIHSGWEGGGLSIL